MIALLSNLLRVSPKRPNLLHRRWPSRKNGFVLVNSDTQRNTRTVRRIRRMLWITGALAFIVVLVFVHEFLAVSSPSGQGILVVEAWVPMQSLADSAEIFRGGHYQYLVLVGGPVKQ